LRLHRGRADKARFAVDPEACAAWCGRPRLRHEIAPPQPRRRVLAEAASPRGARVPPAPGAPSDGLVSGAEASTPAEDPPSEPASAFLLRSRSLDRRTHP